MVDRDTYLYIYNEIFVRNWNQYIKRIKADSYFIISKWLMEEAIERSMGTFSHAEKIELYRRATQHKEYRVGKKGRYFQKLVDNFDRERKIIICHNSKFYTYEIETKFAEHISIYLIDESEITSVLNHLYLRIRKGNRIAWRQRLFRDFETDDED
jgi:hypothetical protein